MSKRRDKGDGAIDRRGADVWRLRYRIDRRPYSTTFHGSLTDARKELRRLIKSGDDGTHVEPSRLTVGEFVSSRVDQWEASGDISARTAQRYRELVKAQIKPHLGDKAIQKLKPLDIEA